MAKTDKSFSLENIDKDKVNEILSINQKSTDYFIKLVENEVNKFTNGLDGLMNVIQKIINDPKEIITDSELENVILKLPNYLYFCGQALENLSIRKDIAKSDKQNKYSEVHMNTTGTVADKDAKASQESLYEQILENLFDAASKKIERKIKAGYEMLSAAKKVLQRRMLEIESTKINLNTFSIRDDNRIEGEI